MIRIENIIADFREVNGKQVDCSLIQKAYIIAAKSKTFLKILPSLYLQNALEVAQILIDLKLDIQTVTAGILYGVLLKDEDKPASRKKESLSEIEELLGKEAADIVDGIHNILKASNIENKEKRMAEKMRQMIFASSKDIRILFVSLAARLVRMRHSKRFYNFTRSIDAGETLKIYSPLADRLGLAHIKIELENLAFDHLYPKEAKQVRNFCKKNEKFYSSLLENLRGKTQRLLDDNKIEGFVKGRLKHYYSIFRKSRKTEVDYDQLHDLVGVRIIVETIDDCYKALGLINNFYRPVTTSFKNYISFPKPNGYQSLHIDVYGRDGRSFDVQIRTRKMDDIAERGVAAHWAYKKKQTDDSEEEVGFSWLQDLSKSLNITNDAGESLEIFSRELYSDFVYALTPRGKMIKLQAGATALDFAFAVHSEIGMRCVGAKINGVNRPIKTALKHGDKVDILTSSKQTPSPGWLLWAKTSKALAKIRNYLRKEEREDAEKMGRELFSSYVSKTDKSKKEILNSSELISFIRSKGNKDIEGYYAQLGFGQADIEELDKIFNPVKKKALFPKTPKKILPFGSSRLGVKIVGVDNIGSDNMKTRYAKCCRPLKGDRIAGVISQGKGVTVHLADCKNISGIIPERIVEVEWLKSLSEKLPVSVRLLFNNNIKTSLKIMKVLAAAKVALLESNMSVKYEDEMVSEQTITIKVDNSEQLEKILKKFNSLPSVRAYRIKDEETARAANQA